MGERIFATVSRHSDLQNSMQLHDSTDTVYRKVKEIDLERLLHSKKAHIHREQLWKDSTIRNEDKHYKRHLFSQRLDYCTHKLKMQLWIHLTVSFTLARKIQGCEVDTDRVGLEQELGEMRSCQSILKYYLGSLLNVWNRGVYEIG